MTAPTGREGASVPGTCRSILLALPRSYVWSAPVGRLRVDKTQEQQPRRPCRGLFIPAGNTDR